MEVTVIPNHPCHGVFAALLCPGHRPRNAAATRTAILDAARERFAAESYDDVGMRDIARTSPATSASMRP